MVTDCRNAKPKIGIIGYSRAGKSTVGRMLAGLTGGESTDTGSLILAEYAKANSLEVADVLIDKPRHRGAMYDWGAQVKATDPAAWVKGCLARGNIAVGMRDREEMEAARPLLDWVVWVNRPGVHADPTDQVGPGHADRFINGGIDSDDWEEILRGLCAATLQTMNPPPPADDYRRVYLSGPMSGLLGDNMPAFIGAAARWREAGYEVLSPAEMDDGDPRTDWESYLSRDLPAILTMTDAVVMLNGWLTSRGGRLEAFTAMSAGKPMIEDGTNRQLDCHVDWRVGYATDTATGCR